MSKKIITTVKAYLSDGNIFKRYIRIAEAAKFYEIDSVSIKVIASAASAVYQLPRTTLISLDIFDDYMEQFRENPVPMKNHYGKKVRCKKEAGHGIFVQKLFTYKGGNEEICECDRR